MIEIITEKKCTKCGNIKSINNFYERYEGRSITKKSHWQSHCKECMCLPNPEASKRGYLRERGKPDFQKKRRAYTLNYYYGITTEFYNDMFSKQNGKCAICGSEKVCHTSTRQTNLYVDHNHKTGKIRGLLCYRCNQLLGRVEDNTELLEKAIQYINNEFL
jgi:hypothetical protein